MKELEPTERLGKDVGWVEIARDMRHHDKISIDVIADPVAGSVYVLHCALVFRMFSDLQSRLIVKKEGRRPRHVITQALEEVPHPHNLTPCL